MADIEYLERQPVHPISIDDTALLDPSPQTNLTEAFDADEISDTADTHEMWRRDSMTRRAEWDRSSAMEDDLPDEWWTIFEQEDRDQDVSDIPDEWWTLFDDLEETEISSEEDIVKWIRGKYSNADLQAIQTIMFIVRFAQNSGESLINSTLSAKLRSDSGSRGTLLYKLRLIGEYLDNGYVDDSHSADKAKKDFFKIFSLSKMEASSVCVRNI